MSENDLIKKENLLYEGKGKRLYKVTQDSIKAIESKLQDSKNDSKNIESSANDSNKAIESSPKINPQDVVLAYFKDDLTAFNAQKKSSESGKGALNCQISTQIFNLLESKGVKTHHIATLDSNIMLCSKVEIIPIEVVVRNIATGSLTKRLGIKEGLVIKDTPLHSPLVEFYYKDDSLGDPIITHSHCLMMGIASSKELEILKLSALKVNEILREYFDKAGLNLIDFKLEFGRSLSAFSGDSSKNSHYKGEILLADEISPDSCRLWDKNTNKKMDKDIFRQNLGNVVSAYREVLERIK